MRNLLECRDAIDAIDQQILKLLKERQNVACDIARCKLASNKGIVDKEREQQKLRSLMDAAFAQGLSPTMVKELYVCIMAHTVSHEQSLIVQELNNKNLSRSTSVAYLGTTGTYSHLATHRYFEHFNATFDEVSCSSFDEIVAHVDSGRCEYGLLPIENSNSGSINEAVDTMQLMQSSIVGEIFFPIDHSVLSLSHDLTLPEITTIYTHPQPAAQCSHFLSEHLPHARIVYTNSSSDAMSKVKELNDPHVVALGSMHAARYYALCPLVTDIANNDKNYTRFIVLSKTPIKVPMKLNAKTSLLFSVAKYEPGSLLKVLTIFSQRNLNLTKLYSRPLENKQHELWEEIFFVDIEGNLDCPEMQHCLDELASCTTNLKILGCYVSAEQVQHSL